MIEIPPEILAVLDLKQGQVVHAVAGHREKYQPLISAWTPDAHDPIELTTALSAQLGLREYYIADLDAIEQHDNNHLGIIHQLINHGYSLWLDAGFTILDDMKKYIERGVQRIILSSESLPRISLTADAVKLFGSDRIVFSLDFVEGKVRCRDETVDRLQPEEILKFLIEFGISQFILLDLADVGTSRGPTMIDWCKKLKSMKPDCTLITGGGIRDISDITMLTKNGVTRVLVSTWLHLSKYHK